MNKKEAEAWLAKKNNFNNIWDYYDVNDVGRIDAVGCGTFFRRLTRKLGDLDL